MAIPFIESLKAGAPGASTGGDLPIGAKEIQSNPNDSRLMGDS
jgi:hypothetical protein